MSAPTGKLKFAYDSIANLEQQIDTLRAQLAAAEARAERLEGLSPIYAAETARRARAFLHAFVGQGFGEFAECGSHDRQHLGIALDYVEELSSMVLALAAGRRDE